MKKPKRRFECPRCTRLNFLKEDEPDGCMFCGYPTVCYGVPVRTVDKSPESGHCAFDGRQESVYSLMNKPMGYRLIRGFNLMRGGGSI